MSKRADGPPLESIEYYEVMVFLIHEQYEPKSLDKDTGALDVGAHLRGHELQEDFYLQSLRRRYAIDQESFMVLDGIARGCMGEAKKGSYHENKLAPAIAAPYGQQGKKESPRAPSAPQFTPTATSRPKSFFVRSVEAEPSINAEGVRMGNEDPPLTRSQHHDADVDVNHTHTRTHTRTRRSSISGSEDGDVADNLAIKLWACCCCFLIMLLVFFSLQPISLTPVKGGFNVRSD
jgi:hypothetical protein